MKRLASAFVAGLIFALGLVISGMTNPEKVIAFLDITGAWDPSLAFVMGGALAVHAGVAQWAVRAARPLWSGVFDLPPTRSVNASLVAGAALFGLGWGIAGMCPGPALVNLVTPSASGIAFVAAMLLGIMTYHARLRFFRRPGRADAPAAGLTSS